MEMLFGAVIIGLCMTCIVICIFQDHDDDDD